MAIEIFDKIYSKLRLREVGWTEPPTPLSEGSPVDWDIEDSFTTLEDDPEFQPIPKINPNSELE